MQIINYEAFVKDIEYRNEHNKCSKEYTEGARDTLEIAKLFIYELSPDAPTVEPCYQTTSCLDCKMYDKENHHCPRFCEVIRELVKEAENDSV